MDNEFKTCEEWAKNDHNRSEEWQEENFPFRVNHLAKGASCGGTMFETYGKELEFIKNLNPAHVWTYQDDDNGNPCFTSGYHVVNRIGYFYSDTPVQVGREIYIKLDVRS